MKNKQVGIYWKNDLGEWQLEPKHENIYWGNLTFRTISDLKKYAKEKGLIVQRAKNCDA